MAEARLLGFYLGLKRFTRCVAFYRLDLTNLPESCRPTITLKTPSLSEVMAMPHYSDGWFTREEAIKRLRTGHQLFVAPDDDGEVVCFGWSESQQAKIGWFDLTMRLPEDVVYNTCLYTVPHKRGHGLGFAFWLEVAQFWKRKGLKQVFVVIDPNNVGSIKLHLKLGFKKYQTLEYRRFMNVRRYRVCKANSGEVREWVGLWGQPDLFWRVFWN